MAKIIESHAWSSPTFSGWSIIIEAEDETDAETAAAAMGHVADVTKDPRGFAVLVVAESEPNPTRWATLIEAERKAYAEMQASESDEDGDRWTFASLALMNHPAPDLAALRYKLNRLFPADEDGEETNCWAWRYAGQTVRDIRRLIPGGEA